MFDEDAWKQRWGPCKFGRFDNHSAMLKKFESAMRCDGCYKVIWNPPIYQCNKSHQHCKKCRDQMTKESRLICSCGEQILEGRSKLAETILETLCKNYEYITKCPKKAKDGTTLNAARTVHCDGSHDCYETHLSLENAIGHFERFHGTKKEKGKYFMPMVFDWRCGRHPTYFAVKIERDEFVMRVYAEGNLYISAFCCTGKFQPGKFNFIVTVLSNDGKVKAHGITCEYEFDRMADHYCAVIMWQDTKMWKVGGGKVMLTVEKNY